jgi:signal transduction histidine kinase/GAF domain-containing protein
VHGEVIGYLALDSRQVAAYSQAEADLAQAFANQAAIAIENARLHTKSARWAEQLTILNKAGRTLASSLDLDLVLEQVVIETMTLVEAEGASLLLVEAEGEELTFVASISPASERLIGVRMSATAGIAGWAVQTKQSVLVDDVQNDPRFYQSIDVTTQLATRALIAVPLIVRDTVVGVIEVINKLTGSFDQSDLEVLEALGSSAAIAIENAQLFETIRHSQERYRDLFDNSPISIWEQNFSEVKTYLDQVRSGGVNDLGGYFKQHPSEVIKCIKLVKVVEVNQASLALYQARNKEELLIDIDAFFSRVTYDTFRAILVAMAAGQTPYEGETVNQTLLGDKVYIWLRLSIAPEYQATWSKVLISIIDITELKQAEAVMRKQRQNLRRLSVQLITTQEAERKRLAYELHDEMGQALTAIGLNLEVIEQELSPLATPGTKKRLVDTISLVDQTLAQIRELSLNLRPSMLDDLGLVATLSWYTKQYAARGNIEVELNTSDFEGRLKPEVEIALYRVVQEALTNVARHTQAQRVYLRLARPEAAVTVLIEDDGSGFDVEEVANRQTSEPGLGLIGIRERVTALGGRLEIQSQPGRGTKLFVEIPLLR